MNNIKYSPLTPIFVYTQTDKCVKLSFENKLFVYLCEIRIIIENSIPVMIVT